MKIKFRDIKYQEELVEGLTSKRFYENKFFALSL